MTAPAVLVLDTVVSTNDAVRDRLASGQRPPIWLRARVQTAGRGRRGRAWVGVEGNLFLSGAAAMPAHAPASQLSFIVALAVFEALTPYVAAGGLTLKWPNDVLVGGAKIAGILLESDTAHDAVVIGVGVNVAAAPAGVDQAAIALTDVSPANTPAPDLDTLAQAVADGVARWSDSWRADGFGPIRTAWLKRAGGLGAPVAVTTNQQAPIVGVFDDLDADGSLLVRDAAGRTHRVTAGDVRLITPAVAEEETNGHAARD